jgi:hypothetical protein
VTAADPAYAMALTAGTHIRLPTSGSQPRRRYPGRMAKVSKIVAVQFTSPKQIQAACNDDAMGTPRAVLEAPSAP